MKMKAEVGKMQPQAKDTCVHPKAEESGRVPPESLQREPGPADTLTSDFWPPEVQDGILLLFAITQFVIVCYRSLPLPPHSVSCRLQYRPSSKKALRKPARKHVPISPSLSKHTGIHSTYPFTSHFGECWTRRALMSPLD